MVQSLINSGAAITGVTEVLVAASSGYERTLQILLDRGANVTTTYSTGCTALYKAVWRDHESAVHLLLRWEASVCAVDTWGRTPLHYSRSVGITQLLLDHGVDVEASDNVGKTSLHAMAGFDFVQCVEYLLDQGAAIDAKDGSGMTPLLRALVQGLIDCMRTLLYRGGDIEALDCNGMTPPLLAMAANRMDVVELLVDEGANVNVRDDEGMAALSIAAIRGDTVCVRFLLERGALMESGDVDSMTALLHAVIRGRTMCTKLLLDAGANISAKTTFGATAVQIFSTSQVAGFSYDATC